MKATYRITEDDYVNAMKLAAKTSVWLLLIYSILSIALILLVIFGPLSGITIAALAGSFIFAMGWRYIGLPIISRRHYRKSKLLHEESSIELLEDGIRSTSSTGNGKLTWDKMLKWRQNKNCILIYLAPRLFAIIPKRIGSNGFDNSLLSSTLLSHVGKPS